MSRECALTGKKVITGNNVSHAHNRTKRRFLPNLQRLSLPSRILGRNIRLRIAVSTLRTINKKGGLDQFLINSAERNLTSTAKKLKKEVLAKASLQN